MSLDTPRRVLRPGAGGEPEPRPAYRPEAPASNRRRLYLILGAVTALAGFGLTFLIGSFVSGSSSAAVPIVVAARDVGARTVLSADDLVVRQVAAADAPPLAVIRLDEAQGMALMSNLKKGQPVLSNQLAKSPDQITTASSAYLPIAAGYVALSIPSSEQTGVSGYIQSGDWITVVASVNLTLFGAPSRPVTKTVFTNVHVIRAGSASQDAQGGRASATASSLTVVMTQCDAEYMYWLLGNSSMRYVLESYHDYAAAPSEPDPACPAITKSTGVSPAQADARFGFTKV